MTDIKKTSKSTIEFIDKKVNISDFIPYYSTYDNIDYYPSIMGKKEIYAKLKEMEPKQNGLFTHQKLISRFMSSHTLNDSILLYHEMGAGKTFATIAICEQIRRESSTIQKAYIFAKSKLLLKNFLNEIKIFTENFTSETPSSIKQFYRIKKKHPVKNKKTFNTFATALSKRIKLVDKKKTIIKPKYSDEQLIKDFSNSIIIMDEIHNIRDLHQQSEQSLSKDNVKQIYDIFYHFLHTVQNCKIILLSGTPMRDSAIEMIDILNLIIPQKNKLQKDYFFQKRDNTYYFDRSKTLEFKKKIKGYVSVLENEKSEIKKVFTMGVNNAEYKNILGYHLSKIKTGFDSNYIKFHILPMEQNSLQEQMYLKNKKEYEDYLKSKKDKKMDDTKRLKDRFREISKLVYPGLLFGKTGFDEYIETQHQTITDQKGNTFTKKEYKLKDNFIDTILKKNITHDMNDIQKQEKMIHNIQEISNKFAYVIKEAIRCYRENKCMFVYCREIQNAGIILLNLLLQYFGYKQVSTVDECSNEAKRMIILTSNQDISKPSHFQSLNKLFNEEKNKKGQFIQLIIASDTISEGYSFFHIQREIIMTPWYNFSKIDQIIARGIRAKSHRYLDNKEIEISLLVSVCTHEKTYDSIDLEQYMISILKDKEIKKMYRILKESSFDCQMFYDRNKSVAEYRNNTRECDYEQCKYECDVKKECLDLKNDCDGKDRSTYNLYYIHEKKNQSYQTEKMIIQLFFKKYNIEKTDIKTLFQFIDNYFKSSHKILKRNILNILKLDEKEGEYEDKIIELHQIINDYNPIIQEIKQLFQTQNIISYNEIVDHFKYYDMDHFQLLYFLNYIIENNIIIRNQYYLREDKNMYYIVNRVEMIQQDKRLIYYLDEKKSDESTGKLTEYQFRKTYQFDHLQQELNKMSDYIFYFVYPLDDSKDENVKYTESLKNYNTLKNTILKLHFKDDIVIKEVKDNIKNHGYSFLNEHKSGFNFIKQKTPIYLIQFYFKNYLQQISDNKVMFNYHFQSFVFDINNKTWSPSTLQDQMLLVEQKNKLNIDNKIICRYDSTDFVIMKQTKNTRKLWIINNVFSKVKNKLNNQGKDARTFNTGKQTISYEKDDLKKIIKHIISMDYNHENKKNINHTQVDQNVINDLKKSGQNEFYKSKIIDHIYNQIFQHDIQREHLVQFIEEWCFFNNYFVFKSSKESKEFKKQKLLLIEPIMNNNADDTITFVYDLSYIDKFKHEQDKNVTICVQHDIQNNIIYLQSIQHSLTTDGFENYIIEMLKEIKKKYLIAEDIIIFTQDRKKYQRYKFKQIKS